MTRGEVKVALDMQEMTCGNSSMTEGIATVTVGIGEMTRGEVTVALDMREMIWGNSSMTEDIAAGRLSIKLCLGRDSPGFLKPRLEQGIELR